MTNYLYEVEVLNCNGPDTNKVTKEIFVSKLRDTIDALIEINLFLTEKKVPKYHSPNDKKPDSWANVRVDYDFRINGIKSLGVVSVIE